MSTHPHMHTHTPFQVLMYGNARVAEEVCHLNRWDKCFLPINALETALELRQLDTLSFFLRSKESGRDEEGVMCVCVCSVHACLCVSVSVVYVSERVM